MIDKIIDKMELIVDRVMHASTLILNIQENIVMQITGLFNRLFNAILALYEEITMRVYGFFRWTTIPLNFLIIRTFLWYIFKTSGNEPLDEVGVHYIRAEPGGGKSMLAYQKANETLEKTGYSAYITHPIEKPKLTEDKKWWYVDHRLIGIRSYFNAKGEQIKRFNTAIHKQLHVDEFHIENNPRRNKEKEYNAFFIPFLNQLLKLRHNGFDNNIYIYSQIPNNDIQLMSTITMYHEIKLVKGMPYLKWLRDGKFEIVPIKWKFKSYKIIIVEGGGIKRKLYRIWNKPVDYMKLEHFDTHALRNDNKHLPLDFEKKKGNRYGLQ